MLSETFKKVGLLSLGISLALTSCSEDVEETSTATAEPTANLEVSQAIIYVGMTSIFLTALLNLDFF